MQYYELATETEADALAIDTGACNETHLFDLAISKCQELDEEDRPYCEANVHAKREGWHNTTNQKWDNPRQHPDTGKWLVQVCPHYITDATIIEYTFPSEEE